MSQKLTKLIQTNQDEYRTIEQAFSFIDRLAEGKEDLDEDQLLHCCKSFGIELEENLLLLTILNKEAGPERLLILKEQVKTT